MLMIVGPAAPPVFAGVAGICSTDCSTAVFPPPPSSVTEAGRLCGASAGGTQGSGVVRSCLAGTSAGVGATAGGSGRGTHGTGRDFVRSRVAGTAVDAAGNAAGTHGAGGDFARSRFATARPGASFAAGNSGGTQGAGTLPASICARSTPGRCFAFRHLRLSALWWGRACTTVASFRPCDNAEELRGDGLRNWPESGRADAA